MKENSTRKTLADLEGLIEKQEKAKERSRTARARKKDADLREIRVEVHLEDHAPMKAILKSLAALTRTQRANGMDSMDDLKKIGSWVQKKTLHLELELVKARVANLDLPQGEGSTVNPEWDENDANDPAS